MHLPVNLPATATTSFLLCATQTEPRNTADIEVVMLDVTSAESISDLLSQLKDRLPDGKLDIIVNNAGFEATGPQIKADLATAKRLHDVNVLGLLAVT